MFIAHNHLINLSVIKEHPLVIHCFLRGSKPLDVLSIAFFNEVSRSWYMGWPKVSRPEIFNSFTHVPKRGNNHSMEGNTWLISAKRPTHVLALFALCFINHCLLHHLSIHLCRLNRKEISITMYSSKLTRPLAFNQGNIFFLKSLAQLNLLPLLSFLPFCLIKCYLCLCHLSGAERLQGLTFPGTLVNSCLSR